MNQIITELNIFEGESEGMEPLKNSLNYRHIINDPIEYKVGTIILNGDIPNKFIMNDINFINLMASRIFTIIINQNIILFTKQFSFMNEDETINLILIPRFTDKTNIKYSCGFINSINNETPVFYSPDYIDSDKTIDEIIVEKRIFPDDILYTILGKNLIS